MSFADRRLHMIGIGGAGVSALATVAYAWGADVTGCDRAPSEYSDRLARFGVPVSIGHDPAHLEPGVEVVVSSAIAADEPELLAARELGLPRLPVLAEFEGRQRRHAHFRPQMTEQSQSRRRVDAERRAERLHLGHGTAGRQIRRPFLAIGQALGQ